MGATVAGVSGDLSAVSHSRVSVHAMSKPEEAIAARRDIGEHDRLWIAAAAAAVGAVVWTQRDAVWPLLVAEGLASPGVGTAGTWHLNFAGWCLAGLVLMLVVSAVRSVAGWVAWSRWEQADRCGPVPVISAAHAAAAVAGAGGVAGWGAFGLGWGLLVMLVLLIVGAVSARRVVTRFTVVAVFTGRAVQVLGHGARVRAGGWQRWAGTAGWVAGEEFPARLECQIGPGWQGKPGELAELGRLAAEVNWPGPHDPGAYRWRTDFGRHTVVGEFARDW